MTYKITYEDRAGYLFVKLEGPESYEAALHFWENLAVKATTEEIKKILIMDNVVGRLATIELHRLSEIISTLFIGRKVAFVDLKDETFNDNKFGETVVLNRGGVVKLFNSEASGLAWLL